MAVCRPEPHGLPPVESADCQSDKSVLLEVNNPLYEEARDALARFAELEKSPEHILSTS